MFGKNSVEVTETNFKDILGSEMIEMAGEDSRLLVFDADLANASGLRRFADTCPDQFVECGIQEANMVGAAAASSEAGCIPFAHTFAAFASRKCIDQVFLAGCYADMNLKLIGSDPGITAATNGGSHQAMEDMSVFLGLHNITLLEPSDCTMFTALLRLTKKTPGVFYIRSNRKENRKLYPDETQFELGKGRVLRDGTDATVIASGIEVYEALKAAEKLQEKGLSVRVVDMYCWKPVDEELIERCARETGAIITAENHTVASGLGSTVAKVASECYPVPMAFVGIKNRFGEVGSIPFLMQEMHLDAGSIANAVEQTVARKRQLKNN